MLDYFVIMGARVLPGGRISGTLQRRAEGALALAGSNPDARFLATGGVTEDSPSEAEVVRDWLVARGVTAERILVEPRSLDTLDSAEACAELILSADAPRSVTVCTDRFHVLRSTLLLRIFGVRAKPGWIASGVSAMGLRAWLFYWIRDLAGLVWDVPIALARRWKRPS
jgi:uncharacterized SAM-binding protein YcdF (DUF218 family)